MSPTYRDMQIFTPGRATVSQSFSLIRYHQWLALMFSGGVNSQKCFRETRADSVGYVSKLCYKTSITPCWLSVFASCRCPKTLLPRIWRRLPAAQDIVCPRHLGIGWASGPEGHPVLDTPPRLGWLPDESGARVVHGYSECHSGRETRCFYEVPCGQQCPRRNERGLSSICTHECLVGPPPERASSRAASSGMARVLSCRRG